jgi:hypothetical protein
MTTRREAAHAFSAPHVRVKRDHRIRERTERNGGRTRPSRSGPQSGQIGRPTPPTSASQAKARAKARKAKAPKAVRLPLRDRLVAQLTSINFHPRALAKKVPFVVLVIGSLAMGLGFTLWLSTDSAERSYEVGNARERNRMLAQQKESLERDVLEAQAAPALADAARNLGMIPSQDSAHLIQDPSGNWVVVGDPRPAEGTPPPPLNTRLPDPTPATPAIPVNRTEVPVLVPSPGRATPAPAALAPPTAANPEVLVRMPPAAAPGQTPAPAASPGPLPAPPAATGPLPGPPAPTAEAVAPAPDSPPPAPTAAPPA